MASSTCTNSPPLLFCQCFAFYIRCYGKLCLRQLSIINFSPISQIFSNSFTCQEASWRLLYVSRQYVCTNLLAKLFLDMESHLIDNLCHVIIANFSISLLTNATNFPYFMHAPCLRQGLLISLGKLSFANCLASFYHLLLLNTFNQFSYFFNYFFKLLASKS